MTKGRPRPLKPGDHVRYKPGSGTYGYEDVLEADGRLGGVVVGHSRTRVRVELTLGLRGTVTRCVDAASLIPVDAAIPAQTGAWRPRGGW